MPDVQSSGAAVVVQFAGHPQELDWDEAYLAARTSVEEARGVRIYDFADLRSDANLSDVALLIRVLRSAEHSRRHVRHDLIADCARQATNHGLAVGISPYGADGDAAAEAIVATYGPAPVGQSRWVIATSTLEQLRALIARWLFFIVDRRYSPSQVGVAGDARDKVLSEELPAGPGAAETVTPRRFRGMPR